MSETTVTVARLHRPELERLVRSLPAILSGRVQDEHGIRAGFHARIGHTMLHFIAENFDNLGTGKGGVNGETWARNSPEYLAYGKGPASSRRGTGQMPNNRPGGPRDNANKLGRGPGTGMLSQAQLRQWWSVYMAKRAQYYARGYPVGTAKAFAAQDAWADAKKSGATTKLEAFGHKQDQVLVDRGNLRRSIQPGTLAENEVEASYTPPDGKQIYDSQPTRLVIGTRVPYAAFHHFGKGKRKRRLWPEKFPDDWWAEILGQAVGGLVRIGELARRGAL